MYLWSIQEEAVWQEIQKTGIYHCDPYRSEMLKPMEDELIGKKLEPQFEAAYEWLAEQMEKRVGPRPEDVRFPVWAWYMFDGKRKSDLRKERWMGKGGEHMLCLELEVPDDQVLLSDYEEWHAVLNRWTITDTEEEWNRYNDFLEKADASTADAFYKENWERVFDITPFENDWKRRGRDIQATFWELKREYVKKARPFVIGMRKKDQ